MTDDMKEINNNEEENVINGNDTISESVVKMAEDNIGAITVMAKMMGTYEGLMSIVYLDDMKIRGWKIWYGFKDYCQEDLEKFIKNILEKNEDMRNFIAEADEKMID